MNLLERTARYFVTGDREEHMLSQWVCSIMIVLHWGLGIAILVGGPARFSIPTYQPLVDLTNGHTWMWALQIITSGALMMVPFKWPNIVGLWLGMVWMIIWTGLFSVSVMNSPTAAATPAVAYAAFAMINAALLTARVIEKPSALRG